MDGVHDMGGMHGFGPVPIEQDEPAYHDPWEGRVAVMAGVVMRHTTIDHFRHTIEQMPPAEYLTSGYYERWLWAVERMAAEQGLLDGTGHARAGAQADGRAGRHRGSPTANRFGSRTRDREPHPGASLHPQPCGHHRPQLVRLVPPDRLRERGPPRARGARLRGGLCRRASSSAPAPTTPSWWTSGNATWRRFT